MGGLLQQVRLRLPIVWSHRGSSLQQRHSHEPPPRQKVRFILLFHNAPMLYWLVTPCSIDGAFSLAVFKQACNQELSRTPEIHKYLPHVWVSLPSRTIHYYAELGQRSVFPTCEVPEHFVGQVTVLKYFSHYMEENLMDVSCFVSLPPFRLHAVACIIPMW